MVENVTIDRLSSAKFEIFNLISQKGDFPDFYGFTLYMILAFLQKMAFPMMDKRFHKPRKSVNSLCISFLWFSLKNDNFRLKNKNFEISRNPAYLWMFQRP